jgi:energy-converting hydrogenase Eha subunit H
MHNNTSTFDDTAIFLIGVIYDTGLATFYAMLREALEMGVFCAYQEIIERFGLWCLTPLSTIFQFYRGGKGLY